MRETILIIFIGNGGHFVMSFLDSSGIGTFWNKLKKYMTKEVTCPENILYNSNFVVGDSDSFLSSNYGTPTNYTASTFVSFADNWMLFSNVNMTEFSVRRYTASAGAVRVTGIPSADGYIKLRPMGMSSIPKYGTDITAWFLGQCLEGSAPIVFSATVVPSTTTMYSSGDITLNAGDVKTVFTAGSTAASTSSVDITISFSAGSKIDFYIWGAGIYPVILNDPPTTIPSETSFSQSHNFREWNDSVMAGGGSSSNTIVFAKKSNTNQNRELYKYTYYFGWPNAATANKRFYLAKTGPTVDVGNGPAYTITGRITIGVTHSTCLYDALFTVPVRGISKNFVMGSNPVLTVLANTMPSGYTQPTFSVINNTTEKAVVVDLYPISGVSWGADCVIDYTMPDNYSRINYGGFFNFPRLVDRS